MLPPANVPCFLVPSTSQFLGFCFLLPSAWSCSAAALPHQHCHWVPRVLAGARLFPPPPLLGLTYRDVPAELPRPLERWLPATCAGQGALPVRGRILPPQVLGSGWCQQLLSGEVVALPLLVRSRNCCSLLQPKHLTARLWRGSLPFLSLGSFAWCLLLGGGGAETQSFRGMKCKAQS